jgi:hypothetical protein
MEAWARYADDRSERVLLAYGSVRKAQQRGEISTDHCTKLVQSVSAHVEDVAMEKKFEWEYALPAFDRVANYISIGRDGTTTAIRGEGYRETMCGMISFYDTDGD